MEWINTEDELPEYDERVIVCSGGYVCEGWLTKTDKEGNHYELPNLITLKEEPQIVDYWVPMPKPQGLKKEIEKL